jgi:hypothetical protein
MAQSRRGVTNILEAKVHLLAAAIPRFILIEEPLPSLHIMVQSRCGGFHILEATKHPLVEVIPRFIQQCTFASRILVTPRLD